MKKILLITALSLSGSFCLATQDGDDDAVNNKPGDGMINLLEKEINLGQKRILSELEKKTKKMISKLLDEELEKKIGLSMFELTQFELMYKIKEELCDDDDKVKGGKGGKKENLCKMATDSLDLFKKYFADKMLRHANLSDQQEKEQKL